LRASIRLYADSAVSLVPAGKTPAITIPAGKTETVRFALPESPWPLGDGFFPLAVFAVRSNEHTWSREGGVPPASPPIMR
jgi:hypothetical protein